MQKKTKCDQARGEAPALLETLRPLLIWYAENARPLPWRENPTPYRVWLSEVMLQQTRIEAVRPYYARFLAAAPSISALAALPEPDSAALGAQNTFGRSLILGIILLFLLLPIGILLLVRRSKMQKKALNISSTESKPMTMNSTLSFFLLAATAANP